MAGEALVSRGISLEVITDIFKLYSFIYLFLPVQGLHCSTWAFSSCGKQGLFSVQVHASHCGGSACCRALALGSQASVVTVHGPSSCPAWAYLF